MTVIETQRLILREMTFSDYPDLCRILQDGEVMYAYNGAFSDEETMAWLEKQTDRYREWGYGLWAVTLKAPEIRNDCNDWENMNSQMVWNDCIGQEYTDYQKARKSCSNREDMDDQKARNGNGDREDMGRMIGQCGLTRQMWNGREMLEVGYLFKRSCWHQGYATEAVRACIEYAFTRLRATEVCSIIRDSNIPSQRVAFRCGMEKVPGVMVKHYRGAEMPHWLYVAEKKSFHGNALSNCRIHTVRLTTPCGDIRLGAFGDRLCLCGWSEELHPGRVENRLKTLLKAEFHDCGDITGTGAIPTATDRQSSHAGISGHSGSVCPAENSSYIWCAADTEIPQVLLEAARQLDEYFKGRRTTFDIPLLPVGSAFQKRVWQQLQHIPYGSTVSYGELAAAIGSPDSVRAVANANGANAISIIIPCHRVIGSNGSLTGYGGGIAVKRFLLELERSHLAMTNQ